MNNFERIKQMSVNEMVKFFLVIETHFKVVDIDPNGIKQWLLKEYKDE